MTDSELRNYFHATFPDVHLQTANGNHFYFARSDQKMPFATLVCSDEYDAFSNLNRSGVFRLNLGVSQATFDSLELPAEPDFTALDQWLPHPVYGSMHWVCVLNPAEKTWARAQKVIAEAHARALR